ncbi:hypothetical protein MUU77_03230 [Pseudoxanthomonas sp. F37]|uniref:hypothetical protein n=1 Tax=Pseudoxanthomonas sp. F37 TaxID=2932492 RepID=UPI001FD1F218|nr:hypothetical protein [Pseudoxanthomonas sp. F37]UOV09334.1 hypothetical protein MUU77_03230 [Pseudoxanthomonas sp. F37]
MPTNDTLTFTELERRLRAVPDGPAGILNTPPLYRIANMVGGVGLVVALIPIVLVRLLPAAPWMVTMVQMGFSVMVVAWLPVYARQLWTLLASMWKWRQEQAEQLDHDRPEFEAIMVWLCQQPADALAGCQRMVALTHRLLVAKLGLLAGGLDRLGVLPALVAAYLFLRNVGDILDMPLWELLIAAFLILLWLVIVAATLMRIRLQLYESLLSEALAMKSGSAAPAA